MGFHPEAPAVGARYSRFRYFHHATPQADLAGRRRRENPETIVSCPAAERATHGKFRLGLTHIGNHLRLDEARSGIRSLRGTHIFHSFVELPNCPDFSGFPHWLGNFFQPGKGTGETIRGPRSGETHLGAGFLAHSLEIITDPLHSGLVGEQGEIKYHHFPGHRPRPVHLHVVDQRGKRFAMAAEGCFRLPFEPLALFAARQMTGKIGAPARARRRRFRVPRPRSRLNPPRRRRIWTPTSRRPRRARKRLLRAA